MQDHIIVLKQAILLCLAVHKPVAERKRLKPKAIVQFYPPSLKFSSIRKLFRVVSPIVWEPLHSTLLGRNLTILGMPTWAIGYEGYPGVCGWNPSVLPFNWTLLRSTFMWCWSFLDILQKEFWSVFLSFLSVSKRSKYFDCSITLIGISRFDPRVPF